MPKWGDFEIGGINAGQFLVMLLGGIIGIVIMRFAATKFISILEKYPSLETAAFVIVGWVGVKLVVMTLSHEKVHVLSEEFPETILWKTIFWGVLILIALIGFITGVIKNKNKK